MSKPKIMIDAGHGGKDPGALGPRGEKESDVALAVALLLGAQISSFAEPLYTRRDDTFLELGERARRANAAGADFFISIHCNSGPPGQGEGFEVFTSPGQTRSDKLATDLFIAYADEFPDLRKRMDLSDGDEDKEARFTVLTATSMPAALFELEFIHTTRGAAFLTDKSIQARMARALATGLRRHMGAAEPKAQAPDVKPSPATTPLRDQLLADAEKKAVEILELIRKGRAA